MLIIKLEIRTRTSWKKERIAKTFENNPEMSKLHEKHIHDIYMIVYSVFP